MRTGEQYALRSLATALFCLLRAASSSQAEEAAVAAAPPVALSSNVVQLGGTSRLLFELTGTTQAKTFAVEGPRIVVDLPQVDFKLDPATGRPGFDANLGGPKSLIRSYRFGQFAPGRSRVVIELARPAKVLRAESVKRAAGSQLEIDLAPEDADRFARAVAAHVRDTIAAAPAKAAAPTPKDDEKSALPLVAIDPGHGGVDMGATSRRGEFEKNIVFEFAKALKAAIEEKGKLRAILTRDDDVFVALSERVNFARERGAELFLSVHADTLNEASVHGATVYTLAAQASDAEAARIAEKENLADKAAGVESREEAEQVGDILFDLTRRETRALSQQLSTTLIAKWRQSGALNKNPARSANFAVLKAFDIPSALLELGYLSSEQDLANLTSPQWRARTAATVADAIAAYFDSRDRATRVSIRPGTTQ